MHVIIYDLFTFVCVGIMYIFEVDPQNFDFKYPRELEMVKCL